jgi:YfiH family protein
VTESGWRLDDVFGVRLARCAAIETIPRVAHAFSTRIAFGRTDFDLGGTGSSAGDLRSDRAAFFRAAGFGAALPALVRQVHGACLVDAEEGLTTPPVADGIIRVASRGAGSPIPAVRTADCVAVVLVDRHATAVAALHAGWRGAAAGIAASAVRRFAREGVDPRDLVVALGPAIRGCCYEVGDDVVTALESACGPRGAYVARTSGGLVSVDLHGAVRQQLIQSGVAVESIHAAPWCTRCRTDLFFSFRGEGPGAGRLMAAVGPDAGP